ncbi:hypothetical protein L6452_06502 [Arctium lappa]|uniref:Uncharacterized protein n=1 Tax=Arctium lappa TaxID=4217 RepID=A0ACB9EJ19_ARCLA|nr:hypothetical protein L6452_06502 [Arctium lappa]
MSNHGPKTFSLKRDNSTGLKSALISVVTDTRHVFFSFPFLSFLFLHSKTLIFVWRFRNLSIVDKIFADDSNVSPTFGEKFGSPTILISTPRNSLKFVLWDIIREVSGILLTREQANQHRLRWFSKQIRYFDVLVEGESERLRFFLLMGATLYFENLPHVYSCSSAGMSSRCNMVDWVVCRMQYG